ncbi:MAG: hypothetical protein P8I03_08035 [Thalassotalea sp.]|nr:hypothetical protein [Thalassotalea sp.]
MLNKDHLTKNTIFNSEDSMAETYLFEEAKAELEMVNQLTPPEEIWGEITKQISKSNVETKYFQQKHILKKGIWAMATAASLIMITAVGLLWSNYSLQHQLEQVLLVNQTIENQLVQDSMPTFHQAQLLSKIRDIDLQLINASTAKEKLKILKQRQQLMAEMVRNSKGKEYEYSI